MRLHPPHPCVCVSTQVTLRLRTHTRGSGWPGPGHHRGDHGMWTGHAAPEHPGSLSSCPGPPSWLQSQSSRWPWHVLQGREKADPSRGRLRGPRSDSPVAGSLSRLTAHGRVPEHPVRSRARPGHPCMTRQPGCEASTVRDHFIDEDPEAGDTEPRAGPQAVGGKSAGVWPRHPRSPGNRNGTGRASGASGAAPRGPCPPAGRPWSTQAASGAQLSFLAQLRLR